MTLSECRDWPSRHGSPWSPTCDFAVGLRGRLPVHDDGAGFALLAHHSHVLGGRGWHWNTNPECQQWLLCHNHLRALDLHVMWNTIIFGLFSLSYKSPPRVASHWFTPSLANAIQCQCLPPTWSSPFPEHFWHQMWSMTEHPQKMKTGASDFSPEFLQSSEKSHKLVKDTFYIGRHLKYLPLSRFMVALRPRSAT